MNERQARALELMRAPLDHAKDQRRDLYEGRGDTQRSGSGRYWITCTAGEQYVPLTRQDIAELLASGLIAEKFPGFYHLALQPPHAGKTEGEKP